MFSLLTDEVIQGSWKVVLVYDKNRFPGTCLITNRRIAFVAPEDKAGNEYKELLIDKEDISSITPSKSLLKSRLQISVNGSIFIFEKNGLPVKLMTDLLKT